MGLRAGLDWCGKSRPTGIRSPDRPAVGSHYTDYATRPTEYISLCAFIQHVKFCGSQHTANIVISALQNIKGFSYTCETQARNETDCSISLHFSSPYLFIGLSRSVFRVICSPLSFCQTSTFHNELNKSTTYVPICHPHPPPPNPVPTTVKQFNTFSGKISSFVRSIWPHHLSALYSTFLRTDDEIPICSPPVFHSSLNFSSPLLSSPLLNPHK